VASDTLIHPAIYPCAQKVHATLSVRVVSSSGGSGQSQAGFRGFRLLVMWISWISIISICSFSGFRTLMLDFDN